MADITTSSLDGILKGNTSSRPASSNNGDLYINTETGFIEIYSSTNGWEAVGAAPSTVTSVSATDVPSGRAYNNGSASVSFTAGSIVGKSYTVTSSPGSYTATGSSSPLTVTGLQSSTQYTYTVTATNNYGSSAASSASSGVTATTVPQAPTIGTATGADSSATLTFTAGATGGSSITNYKYSTDNSTYTAFSPAQTSSPLTISGLTNGQSYSFYLKAVNANGDSTASSVSNSVIAEIPTSYESISTVTVGSSGAANIEFTSIPSTFTHLQIRGICRGSFVDVTMRFNSDISSNYSSHRVYSAGGTPGSDGVYSADGAYGNYILYAARSNSVSGIFTANIIDILDYKNTNKNKTTRSLIGFNEGSSGNILITSGNWRSTSAISTITLTPNSGATFAQYSQFALYGIRGA